MAEFGLENGSLCTPSSDIYKYTPVDSEANEIRVAHILPGSTKDPLLCQLRSVLLRENPTYEALSYTWGTQTDCVEISIDGKKASISENLNSALRRLRLVDKVLTIWVDSICINQNDLVERSAQASRMRFIYRQACSVSVWLGNEDEEKEDGILAATLLQDLDMATEETFNDIGNPTRFIQLEALKRLFRRPYWFRIWVVQEVTCGQSVIVYWGDQHSMPWTRLRELSSRLEARTGDLNLHYPDDPTSVFSLSSGGPKSLQLTRRPGKEGEPPLLDLLYTHMGKLSTLSLDKVYALVGISSSRHTFGPIDYTRSIVDTFIHTARHIITTSRNLDVICVCQNEDVIHKLPSWVPDWERRLKHPKHRVIGLQIRDNPSFRAAGDDSTAIVSFSNDSQILTARGVIVDTIEVVSSEFWKDSAHDDDKKLIDTLQAFMEWWSLYTDYKGRDTSVEEFNRSFCGGSWAASYDIHHDKRVEMFCRLFKELLPSVEFPSAPSFPGASIENIEAQRSTVSGASLRMHNKRFALSRNEKLACLAPAKTQRGDFICLLLGCNYPVLLRKVEYHYILIGEIYVDGIMFGKTSCEGKDLVDFQIH